MYFKNFSAAQYKFGDENYTVKTPDLSAYVDIIDDIKDNLDFYTLYNIKGERPDQLSYSLYDTVDYYWTFFLMNDNIRRQGWPLGKRESENRAKAIFSNTTITTRNSLVNVFAIGSAVTGISSGETGTVLRRNLDLGQIVVSGTSEFINGELVEDSLGNRIEVSSSSEEYNSAKEYVDGDGVPVDFDPAVGPGSLLTAVTYIDYYVSEDEKLNTIKVIKPEAMNSVVSAFKEALRS